MEKVHAFSWCFHGSFMGSRGAFIRLLMGDSNEWMYMVLP